MYHAIPRKCPWNNGRFFCLFLILAQKNRAFICTCHFFVVPLRSQRYETMQIHSIVVAGRVGRTGLFVACYTRAASPSRKLMRRSAPINSFHLSPFTLHLPLPMPAIITANYFARKTIRRKRCRPSSTPPTPARTTTISSAACIAIWVICAIWQTSMRFLMICTSVPGKCTYSMAILYYISTTLIIWHMNWQNRGKKTKH